MKNVLALLVGTFLISAATAWSQTPDTILVNGKILTADERFSTYEALAVHDGKILALGNTADIRKLARSTTRIIDLQGRTAIPGLIDSHLHGIRAGLSFGTEVNWIGAQSVQEAVRRIAEAGQTMKPGSWLIVAGGWNVQQFKERRKPTQAELASAAPNNPVYVQLAYGWVMLNPSAYKVLNVATENDLPKGATFEKDAAGKPTGAISGTQEAIVALFDKLPKPTYDQQLIGTQKFFRELNRLGVTGFIDPGGNNFFPSDYQALFEVWRQGKMTVRVNFALNGQTAGSEFSELQTLTRLLPMGFGDDMLRFNGLGERITWAMNNNDNPNQAQKDAYYQILKWAAERGMSVTMHWNNDASADQLLGMFEAVNREVPITGLRWSIAHLNDASEQALRRMKALGMGWAVQDAMYFDGDQFLERAGEAAARRAPPLQTAKKLGVIVGAGTDAHRVASYNPFTALQWLVDGKTVSGLAVRGPEETPTRADALRLYTTGSAWFSRDETKRGSLEVGKLADLAVLSKDYMTVPLDQIGSIESLLTMVGGKIAYAAQPYGQLLK